jgi:hypothetical protein
MRRIKRARQQVIADSMISFSGPDNGMVEIWCGETKSKLLLPVRWLTYVTEYLSSMASQAALNRESTTSAPETVCPGPSS